MKYKADNYPINIDQASTWTKTFTFPFDGTGCNAFSSVHDPVTEAKLFDFDVDILEFAPKLKVKLTASNVNTALLESDCVWDMLLIDSNNTYKYKLKGPVTVNKTWTRHAEAD